MNHLKILFTSVGRRVELMQAFRSASENKNIALEIYGADCDMTAPALAFCDKKIQVCKIREPEYIPQLIQICQEQKIDLLIPTIDTDLLLLSQNKQAFAEIGTRVLISEEGKIAICRDKRFTADYFISCGLKSPIPVDQVEKYEQGFPCFIKPKDGSSSIDAYKVENEEELHSFAERVADYIVQPFIEGQEYTVDILCDFNGRPIYVTPRQRLAVRSGEVLKTCMAHDEQIEQECLELIHHYKPCGPITVQLIRQKDTGMDYYIEINPRFGGGAPLSMKAGADAAGALLELLLGKTMEYYRNAAREGAMYSRFDQSICVGNGFSAVESAYCHGQESSDTKEGTLDTRVSIGNILDVGTQKDGLQAIVFDLDDTLYSEKDYVSSGYHQISRLFLGHEQEIFDQLWTAFVEKKNAIDVMLQAQNMYSDEMKEKCLRIYRYQQPDIRLYDGVTELLEELRREGFKLGLLTDGRVEGQWAKIDALGLRDLFDEIMVTDEQAGHGDVMKFRKPNSICFEIMQRRLGVPYEKMAYVGDNLKKDFQAPRALGMKCIYFRNADGLYL